MRIHCDVLGEIRYGRELRCSGSSNGGGTVILKCQLDGRRKRMLIIKVALKKCDMINFVFIITDIEVFQNIYKTNFRNC